MKNLQISSAALFVIAAVAGSLAVGAGVFAQSASSSTSTLACSPTTYTMAVGQSVTLAASGGSGSSTYSWSSPGLVITNPTGSNFRVSFNKAGTYPVTVASAGASSTCYVTVTAASTGSTGGVSTPGLPNTGELPE